MFRELSLEATYSRDNCPDLVQEFFVPVLSRAVRYDRATYTFSAEALIVAAAGLAGLINNGGTMRLVCHHELPKDVVNAIVAGERAAEDAVLESLADRRLDQVAPNNLIAMRHLGLLTWLVKMGRLEIKVAIPRQVGAIFHQKVGIFADEKGDGIAFAGSINESRLAWLNNDENIVVFKSWDAQIYFEQLNRQFDRLWNNQSDSSIVITIPEALKQELIDFAPEEPPLFEDPVPFDKDDAAFDAFREELWETINFAIANDPQTSIETISADLWPHQLSFWRRHGRDAGQPPRVLIADEVGLGKTIQAGSVLKTMINSGKADRALILTPAVARWQWQQELRHKFNIEVPVLERRGSQLQLVSSDEERETVSTSPWRDANRLILSYDWLRRNVEQFFADDPEYDMVVFDEAHHARYLEVSNRRRRRDNSYLKMLKRLSERTKGLMLLTATPMQIDPAELWALLQTLQADGFWTEERFSRFYDVNVEPTLGNWDAIRQVYLGGGMIQTAENVAELAMTTVLEAEEHLGYIQMPASNALVLRRDMTRERIQRSMSLMRRSSSVKRSVSRHTRNLLRRYVDEGRLSSSIPQRDVRSIAVEMTDEERDLYDSIRDFVRKYYQEETDINRQALGFVMTHFRLRLGSSIYSFRKSLEDLNERIHVGDSGAPQLDDIPVIGEDDYSDLDPDAEIPTPSLSSNGREMLRELLLRCRALTDPDSKFSALIDQLNQLREDGYPKVMIFSQFRDTQVWLREQLAQWNVSSLVAGLSGPEDWIYQPDGGVFVSQSREVVVREFRERSEGVLLCTETAAESLNFQFCSAILNYDIPWNPMRLEQRIGRIDRIGQEKSVIRVIHLFYKDTVEYDAYTAMEERIQDFQENVGALQPILAANLESIIRESALSDEPVDDVGKIVRNLTPSVGFDLDDLAAAAADEMDPPPLLHMNDLTYILNNPEWLPEGYAAQRRGRNHWRVTTPDGRSHVVTTDRLAHDYSVGTVEFFGPGAKSFPDLSAFRDDGAVGEPVKPRHLGSILIDYPTEPSEVSGSNIGQKTTG